VAHGLPELNPLPLITNELPPFCGVTVIVGCNVREQPDSNTAANIGNTTKRFIVICKNQLGIFFACDVNNKGYDYATALLKVPLKVKPDEVLGNRR